MTTQYTDVAVATYADHDAAEAGVKALTKAGFDPKALSVVGKGYHTEEQVMGFYNTGDRVKVWGKQGAFWGGLWGMLFGGLFITVPVAGPVFFLGYLGAVAVSAIEGAVLVGGASAIAAAIASIGIPKDSVLQYDSAIKADGFLVLVHGDAATVEKARGLLAAGAKSVDVHHDLNPTAAAA